MRRALPILAAVALAAAPASAAGAPPANDDRARAAVLSPPATVQGTTVEATLEPDESTIAAGHQIGGSVWYEVTTQQARRVVVRLAAAGDLDATVDVFRRARSQLLLEDFRATDEDGLATLAFESRARATYLVRVGRRANSAAGAFTLEVLLPQPPPAPPGPALTAGGASGAVNGLTNTADAWSAVLRQGVTYRVNLVNLSRRRLTLSMYPPGTRSFLDDPAVRTTTRGYVLFTPAAGQGGRYSFVIAAGGPLGRQPYRLRVGEAGIDDLWPGRALRNLRRVRAAIDAAGLDVIDTYRFAVRHRSAVALRLRSGAAGAYDLRLLGAGGRRIAAVRRARGAAELKRRLRPGRYVAVVRARPGTRGIYTLRRIARTVTRIRLERAGTGTVDPGAAVRLELRLRPAVGGPATVTIERLDPLTGWHFDRVLRTRIAGGRGAVVFRAPAIGRWRARAAFGGTRRSEASATRRDVVWEVAEPL